MFASWWSHQVILPSTMFACLNTHNTHNNFILHTSNFIILKHQKKRNETPGDPAFYHGRLPQEALEVPTVTWASTKPPRHKVPGNQEKIKILTKTKPQQNHKGTRSINKIQRYRQTQAKFQRSSQKKERQGRPHHEMI